MDNLKSKAIEYFASKPHDDEKAKSYLGNIYSDIQRVLVAADSYDDIDSSLDILEKFVSHVAEDAIRDLVTCWDVLHQGKELQHSDPQLAKYQTKEELYSKIIGKLGQLRYLMQEAVVSTLIKFWHEDEQTRAEIEKELKGLAEFNLYAVQQIGFAPQLSLLKTIQSLSNKERLGLFRLVLPIVDKFLSTDIEGHNWNYKTVSIESMAIPATNEIKVIREGAVDLLLNMYAQTNDVAQKKGLISTMNNACRIWSRAQVSEESKEIVYKNSIEVLNFWALLVEKESMEIVQAIEHDAYWIYYHAGADIVKEAALQVESAIKTNDEYQIYRDLVGFEGIFGTWEDESKESSDVSESFKLRKKNIDNHLASVSPKNIDRWVERVELYLQTESDDLATFPELFRFVEALSKQFPTQVLERLETSVTLDKAAIPIIEGLFASSISNEFRGVIGKWLENGTYLWQLSVAFLGVQDIEHDLLKRFVDCVIYHEDVAAINTFVGAFDEHKNKLPNDFLNEQFEKVFVFLNSKKSTIWINQSRYRSKQESFVSLLSESNLSLLIENLAFAWKVNHRVEAVMVLISGIKGELLFNLLDRRLEYGARESQEAENTYDALPRSLHSLKDELSKSPEMLIALIKKHYRYEWGIDSHGVVRLFKKCFFPFEPQMVDQLFEQLSPYDEQQLNVLLAVTSSYEGDASILTLVRRILLQSEFSDGLCRKINGTLLSTGVVSGEYGLVEAYKTKLENVKPWQDDNEANIVKFAHQYVKMLEAKCNEEVQRVEERIAIEKHQYGVDE
ncbi:hypothetical protein [Pseudoalteromonas phenolica]|uniref:hypothetical protein n=1 Tax=Pseudoalteromonas phenolica TaxID=161398 RepID=UPI00110B2606|nr:hypothetical protein [Pseudoalteromonas phenolica]TMO56362.1 hypothetical protein CWC21_06580 [Pseudoalteromonas phenolica]